MKTDIKNKSIDRNQIELKSFIYDWGLIFLVMLLIFIISMPPLIWNEENFKISNSRNRMLDLAYALKSYNKLTNDYTDDKELIFETIMHVRDSLIANETLSGKKNIYLSCSYEATFLMDPIEGSRVDSQIDLSLIDKKDRLKHIDKTIYDMKNIDYEGTRIYEIPEIDDVKNIPDQVPLIQIDYNTQTTRFTEPSLKTIDSLYSSKNLIRFVRRDCADTVKVDIPRNFGYMLDTLFSRSSIITENVVDTIYTLKEPIENNEVQTSYVKNEYLFRYIPKNEYDSLWNFGIPLKNGELITLDSTYLNKLISDTTYTITYIDDEEFDETEEEASNHMVRKILDMDIWYQIEDNMKKCADYKKESICLEDSDCTWDLELGCIDNVIISEDTSNKNTESDDENIISDDEWDDLFADFEDELKNELEFGDTLKVKYDFKSRFISGYEIINRTINIEDYDRKRYDLTNKLTFSPINGEEYSIILSGNNEFDTGEPYIDANNNGMWDIGEYYTDKPVNYKIISPIDDNYKENRFLIFSFHPGDPGYIENDEVSWDAKPKWSFPIK
tara:strand:- start:5222 stop:6892 length:1671 start_codon:yes stop_codon:yes gene_type:complete